MAIQWGVDQSSTTTYKATIGDTEVTITGLKADSANNLPTEITGKVITLPASVLPDAATAANIQITGEGYTLALDSDVTDKGTMSYEATTSTDSGKGIITITGTSSKGWYVRVDGKKIGYAESSGQELVSQVTGDLKAGLTATDYSLDKVNGLITLNKSAFEGVTLTNNTSTVTMNTNAAGLTLALADDVDRAKKASETDFEWVVTAEKVKVGETDVDTKTAKLQKKVQEGWEATQNTTNSFTYKAQGTLVYATITGLATATEKSDFTVPAKDATVTNETAITLAKKVLPTTKGVDVTLVNGNNNAGITVDGSSVTPKFILALASGIESPGTKRDTTNNPIALTFDSVASGATSRSAQVVQTLGAGWTLDTDASSNTKNKKITYTPERVVELATINGLSTTAATTNAYLGTDDTTTADIDESKFIYLTTGALPTNESISVVLARTPEASLDVYDTTYETVDSAYSLATSGVQSDKAADNTYTTNFESVTTATANMSVRANYNAYWELGKNGSVDNAKITYHKYGPDEVVLAKVTGLATTASVGSNIEINTSGSGRRIILNAGAFPTSVTANTSKVVLDISGDTVEGSTKFSLEGGSVQTPGEQDVVTVTGSGDNYKVQQTYTTGWSLTSGGGEASINTFTYMEPTATDLATISVTGGAASIKAAYFNVDEDENTILVSKAALSSATETGIVLTNATLASGEAYKYKLALGNDVTARYGTETGNPYLSLETVTGGKSAAVRLDLTNGWYIPTNEEDSVKAGQIVYRANDFHTLATITGLSTGAQGGKGLASSVTANISLSGTTVILNKAALGKNEETGIELTNATSESGDAYNYTLKLGSDLTSVDTAPNTTYVGGTASLNFSEGKVSVLGTLNEGWVLDTSDNVSIGYTKASAGAVLATIGGLSTGAAAINVSLGTRTDDSATANVNEYDKNVIYVQRAALADDDATLENATTESGEDNITIGDFKLMLSTNDSNTAAEALGYEPNYAWSVEGSNAYFMQGKEKGWTVVTKDENGDPIQMIDYNERIGAENSDASDSLKAILTVSGLNDDEDVTLTTNNDALSAIDFTNPTKSFVGTEIGSVSVAGLQITNAYLADDTITSVVGDSVKGTILFKRNVLDKGNVKISGDAVGNYSLSLFDNAKEANANTFVPTSDKASIRHWKLNDGAAIYWEGKQEYWSVSGGNQITYKDKTTGTQLAKITGINVDGGLQTMDGIAYYSASKAASVGTAAAYVIEDSFVYSGELGASYAEALATKVIGVSGAYKAADSVNAAQYSIITLGQSALDTTDVKLTTGSDKYRLAVDFAEATPTDYEWQVSGTTTKTAKYYGVMAGQSYLVTERDDPTKHEGKVIKYFANDTDYLLASITGLNKNVTANNDGSLGSSVSGDFSAFESGGISFKEQAVSIGANKYDAFELKSDVLGTANVVLTNENISNYKLMLDTTSEASVRTEAEKEDVWRLDGTTANYRNVTHTYYAVDSLHSGIITTPESVNSGFAQITNLSSGLVEHAGKIYAADDETMTAETELLKIGGTKTVGTATKHIITVGASALNPAKALTLKNGSASYALALSAGIDTVSIGDDEGRWVVGGTNAEYHASLTAGWLVNEAETEIKHYNAVSDKTIFTIKGVKSGSTSDTFGGVTVKATPESAGEYYIAIPDDALGTTDLTIVNYKLQNNVEFGYGLSLSSDMSTSAATAIAGESRWMLNGTSIAYNIIHDAHFEDLATKTTKNTSTGGVSKTTIKYVAEKVDAPIFTITNLAAGLSYNADEDDLVNGRYVGATPVSGIVLDGKKVSLDAAVVSTDTINVTTLTNKTNVVASEAYSLQGGEGITVPTDGGSSFKIASASTVELWQGKTAGYEVNVTTAKSTIAYKLPTQTRKLTTISGLKTAGLSVGGDTPTDMSKVGIRFASDSFSAVISYNDEKVFTIGRAALTTSDVKIDKFGTLSLAEEITEDKTNYALDYQWKVNGTSASYNLGNTAGWTIQPDGNSKTIEYHAAAYNTPVATVYNIKSGLKVGTLKKDSLGAVITDDDGKPVSYVVDSKGNRAIGLSGEDTILVTNFAVNAKDILLRNGDSVTAFNGETIEPNYSFGLDHAQTTNGSITSNDATYVKGKVVTPVWVHDTKDTSKYTYTVTTEAGYDVYTGGESIIVDGKEYDGRIIYTKASKDTTTITGLSANLTISENKGTLANVSISAGTGNDTIPTITVDKAGLGKKNVVLKNGTTKYDLVINAAESTANVWTVSKGTATYILPYKADSYIKKSNTEYTYTGANTGKDINLFTITGLNKDLTIARSDSATTIPGISVIDNQVVESGASVPSVVVTDRTLFAAGNVVLKNNTKESPTDYRFYIDQSNFGTVTYSAEDPLWTFSKGTLTLSEGTSNKWDYKNAGKTNVDYKTLAISKGKTKAVATVKGLATDLVLKTNTEGKVEAGSESHGLLGASGVATPVVTLDVSGETNVINLANGSLIASPKNNNKVALTVPKGGTDFVLGVSGITAAERLSGTNVALQAFQEDNMWSVSKGNATYQYKTSAGWNLDSASKVFTYSDKVKTTTLLKIGGLDKSADAYTTFNGASDAKGNPTDVPVTPGVFFEETGISMAKGETDKGDPIIKFTLTDASKLAAGNVTLSITDNLHNYGVFAADSLAPADFDEKVTVDGKKGTVTLTKGTSAGYTNATGNNEGKRVTFSKEKTAKTMFSVTGLRKDSAASGSTPAFALSSLIKTNDGAGANIVMAEGSALTYDPETLKISITNTDIFDKKAISISGTSGYTFGSLSGTDADADATPKLQIKSGVINVVEKAGASTYSISADSKKINYNNKDVYTILATVKGLNKTLGVQSEDVTDIYTTTTTKVNGETNTTYDTKVGSFNPETGVISLSAAALANSNVTLTLGKTVEKDDAFRVVLGDDVTMSNDDLAAREWTVSKGTATYRDYTKGYYTENDGNYKYTKETKGTTFATITGLDADTAKEAAIAKSLNDATTAGLYSKIVINKDMLNGKNIVLKNAKDRISGDEGAFTLALKEEEGVTVSGLSVATTFTSDKLLATQTKGYFKASDTQITYLKDDKKNQVVAQLSGIDKKANDITVGSGNVIELGTAANKGLNGKSVTLTVTDLAAANGLDYTLKLADGTVAPSVTAATTDPWKVKSGTATFNGFITEGYTLSESKKSIAYTKANGSDATPASGTKKAKDAVYKALMTVKGVTATPTVTPAAASNPATTTVTLTDSAVTISGGLFPVEFSGTSIVGSKDNDKIKMTKTGVTVEPGKGDDSVTLASGGKDTIIYGNGDGNDVITGFDANDTIKLKSGKVTSVKVSGSDAVVRVGTGSIKLVSGSSLAAVNIVDNKGNSLWSQAPTAAASDVLLADDNYSMDAAALSDIVEPFHASYTPYDFESGLDLVKKDSFTPALTYTGDDKK